MSAGRIELDLAIVGGGIQGLSLLHHFREDRRGSAVLIARGNLGDGETLHSHGYLHKGYHLPPGEASSLPAVIESFDWWDGFMRDQELDAVEPAPVYADVPAEQRGPMTRAWSEGNLSYRELEELPVPLREGVYARAQPALPFEIHDRLFQPWKVIEKLAEPLQHLLIRGELTGMRWDPETNRIAECTVSTPGGELRLSCKVVVLATGAHTQALLKNIEAPDGSRPFRDRLEHIHVVRRIPMILIKGSSLPSLTGRFNPVPPINMMTHTGDDGERMWVVTPMEGHASSRDDHREEVQAVDSGVVSKTLQALSEMMPDFRSQAGGALHSAYSGAKIDHPDGLQKWFIGDAGIENLRYVWPVLWGLAHGASRELLRDLTDSRLLPAVSAGEAGGLEAALPDAIRGVPIGEELRLSRALDWHTFEEWQQIHGFQL